MSAIAVLSSASGTIAIAAQRDARTTPVAGLESVAVRGDATTRWRISEATTPFDAADGLVVTWSPASASASLPEITFLGRMDSPAAWPAMPLADQIATGVARAALSVPGSPTSITISRPAALNPNNPQAVHFRINSTALRSLTRAFLTYDLSGLPHWTATVRQINGLPSTAAFHAVSGATGGLQVEEIAVSSLRVGDNVVSYLPADSADAVGYSVRNLRFVAFAGADAIAADATLTPEGSAAAADPRPLIDGVTSTGTTGAAGLVSASAGHRHVAATGYSLNYPSPVQPIEVAFHVAHRLTGVIEFSAGTGRAHRRIALNDLAAGWHKAALDNDAFGPTDVVQVDVRAGHESAGFVSEVHVTTLPVARTDANAARIVLFNPLHGECVSGEGVAIRGALSRSGSDVQSASLYVDGARVPQTFGVDGAFAVTVHEPRGPHRSWQAALRAVFPDGAEVSKTIPLDLCAAEPSARAPSRTDPVDDVGAPFGVMIHPNEAKTISYGNLRLEIPAGSVERDTRITVRPLPAEQLAPMDPGLDNVSPGGFGFRLGPHRTQFLRPLRLTLPYDTSRIPPGMSEHDVRVFYFDEVAHHWQPITTVAAAAAGVVGSATEHFTDFIAGAIGSPEHPSSASLNPNSIRDIKVGDPSAGVTTIQPPSANPMGTGNLSFPIEMPAGRGGMNPAVSLGYSSETDNSWCGVGWNLEVSHVEIDTRFGVPNYSSHGPEESDPQDAQRYLLDGALLVRVAGTAASGTTEYARRVEGSFDRIIRHGTTATKFWWEVSNRTGTRYIYGQTADARLADPHPAPNPRAGAIFRWNAQTVVDPFQNRIEYAYHKQEPAAGYVGEPWVQLYPESIEYSIDPESGARYRVLFTLRDRPFDIISNARAGFDVRTTKLLDRIDVQFLPNGSGVGAAETQRTYRLEYVQGEFEKSLLSAIAMSGRGLNPREMYRHTFEYYGSSPGQPALGFEQPTAWGGQPNGLTHESISAGGGIQGYAGVAVACYAEFAINGGFGPGFDWTTRAMLDANGDGVPDLLTTPVPSPAGEAIELNQLDRNSPDRRHGTFAAGTPMRTRGALGFGATLQGTIGAAINAPFAAGTDLSVSFSASRQHRLLADVDGDGLVDIADTAPILTGTTLLHPEARVHVQRNPFTDPSSLGFGCLVAPCTDETREYNIGGLRRFDHVIQLPPELRETVDRGLHATEPVVRWRAPRAGTVTISGSASLLDRARGGHVAVSILRVVGSEPSSASATVEWSGELTGASWCAGPGTGECGATGGPSFVVGQGERFYFLAHSQSETSSADEVVWSPTVTYTEVGPCPINCPLTQVGGCRTCPTVVNEEVFSQHDNFRLVHSRSVGWTAPSSGFVTYSGIVAVAGLPVGTRVEVTHEHREPLAFTPHQPLTAADLDAIAAMAIPTMVVAPLVDREHVTGGSDINAAGGVSVRRGDRLTFRAILPDIDGADPGVVHWHPRVRYTMIESDARTDVNPPYVLEPAAGTTYRSVIDCRDVAPDQDRVCTLYKISGPGENYENIPESTLQWDPEPAVVLAGAPDDDSMQGWYRGWSVGEWDSTLAFKETEFRAPDPTRAQVDELIVQARALLEYSPSTTPVLPILPVPVGRMTQMQAYRGRAAWRRDPVVFQPETWVGSGADGFVGRGRMKPSRTAGARRSSDGLLRFENVGDVEDTRGATLRAGSSIDWGVTASLLYASNGLTTGIGSGNEDFFDFNGDRRPDSVRYEAAPLGVAGHVRVSQQAADGRSFEAPFDVESADFGALRHVDHMANRVGLSYQAENHQSKPTPGAQNSRTVAGSVSFSSSTTTSNTTVDWQDINGDGLPDHVRLRREGSLSFLDVQLNLGHSLGAVTTVPYADWHDAVVGEPDGGAPFGGVLEQDSSATLSLQAAFQRIGGGPGYTVTRSLERLVDLNGDGLPDRLLHQVGRPYRVKFNLGNGQFSRQMDWNAPAWPGETLADHGLTTSTGFGANISYGIAWRVPVVPIALCIIASVALHVDTHGTSGRVGLEDIDGDGRIDQVLRSPMGGPVYARLNRTGRSNLLRTVRRPLGGSFELEYSRQGNFVSGSSTTDTQTRCEQRGPDSTTALPVVMPQNQWALSAVTMEDGSGSTQPGHVMRTGFQYFDSGFYDRSERENYGYSHVRTTRPDNSSVDAYFYNQDYFKRGLPGLVEEHPAAATVIVPPGSCAPPGRVLRSTRHEYQLLPVTPGVEFPAQTSSSSTLFGADPAIPGLTTTQWQEYDHPVTGSTEWVLGTIHDEGDLGTTQDDVAYRLEYFVAGGLATGSTRCVRTRSVRALPATGASIHLPQRLAAYDPATCFLTSVTDVVTGGTNPVTHAEYDGSPSSYLMTKFEPDAYGNLYMVSQPNGYMVEYTRDSTLHQYVVATTDVFGHVSTSQWDFGFGAPLLTRDINGQKQSFGYDEFGRVTAVYAPGDPNTGDASADATVTFQYSLPTLPTALAPAYAVTHHRSLPGEDTLETSSFIDGFGRAMQVKREAAIDVAGSAVPAMTVSGAVLYDALGRTVQQGQPSYTLDGSTTTPSFVAMTYPTIQAFDEWGRVIATEFADHSTSTTAYTMTAAAAGNTSGTTGSWLWTRTTDPLRRPHDSFSDAVGRILRVTQTNQVGSADPRPGEPTIFDPTPDPVPNSVPLTTDYTYDRLGRLSLVRDALANTTSVAYDSLGRRTAITSPDTGWTEYRYDPAGNLAERVTPNIRLQSASDAIRNTYDHGRLTRVDYPELFLDGNIVPQTPTVLEYGAPPAPGLTVAGNTVGRVARRRDASGVTNFRYGSLGETTRTTQELTNPDDPGGFVGEYVTEYEHDRFGRMRNVTYPNGERVFYRYDAGGALHRVEFNRGGEVGTYVQSILYNLFGQRTRITYGNDVESRFTYDAATRRLDTLATDHIAESEGAARTVTAQSIQYTYARNGNIREMVNSAAGTGSGGPATVSQRYEYDALDQLRSAVGDYSIPTGAGIEARRYVSTLEYDQLGRMTRNAQNESASLAGLVSSTTERNLGYAYPSGASQPMHAPSQIIDHAAAQTTLYQWDANGNQTGSSIDTLPGSRQMQWDHEDRLAQFTQHSGTGAPDSVTRFVYDAGGTRTHKVSTADGSLTLYPNQFMSVRRSAGSNSAGPYFSLTSNHVYAGEERVASSVIKSSSGASRQTYWYHGDHLTSTNWVTNGAGVITEHLEYFPFGQTWVEEAGSGSTGPGTPEAYRYTAKELDSETGLYYFGARYYDPRIALWASADPILASYLDGSPNGGVWNPRNLGLYTYAWNTPAVLRDPDGRAVPQLAAGAVPVVVTIGTMYMLYFIAHAAWEFGQSVAAREQAERREARTRPKIQHLLEIPMMQLSQSPARAPAPAQNGGPLCSDPPPPAPGTPDFRTELQQTAGSARQALNRNLPGEGGQAHHLIPFELRDLPMVARAAAGGWNINGAENGLRMLSGPNVPAIGTEHNGSHDSYTEYVRHQIERSYAENPCISAADAAQGIRHIVNNAREYIRNHGGRLD